jgi:hypothetical protein
MSSRRVQVVVLCEGIKDFRFAYRCLVQRGWRPDQIKANFSKGQSAFDYVLDNYPVEVRANRKGEGQRDLLVIIDGDVEKEEGRKRQLEQHLREAREPARKPGERVALWVPVRHLETWIYFLKHGSADETAEYKKNSKVKEEDRLPAAQKFARILAKKQALPRGALSSMRNAVKEFERIQGRVAPGSERLARRKDKRR